MMNESEYGTKTAVYGYLNVIGSLRSTPRRTRRTDELTPAQDSGYANMWAWFESFHIKRCEWVICKHVIASALGLWNQLQRDPHLITCSGSLLFASRVP